MQLGQLCRMRYITAEYWYSYQSKQKFS